MKNRITVATVLISSFVLILFSIIHAEETRKYDFKDFTKVSVGWGMHVKIEQAKTYNVSAKIDKSCLKYFRVEKDGETLNFFFEKSSWHNRGDVYISITMPDLNDLKLSGGAHGSINMDITGKTFSGDLSGGAVLEGNLKCKKAELDLSGGSIVEVKGLSEGIKVDGSGGSQLKMKSFSAEDVDASLSGGSQLRITTNGTLNVEASGGSSVIYYGKAKLRHKSLSGGSEVMQED